MQKDTCGKKDTYGKIEVKEDCEMYNTIGACKGLKELYCKKEKCRFYKPCRKTQ